MGDEHQWAMILFRSVALAGDNPAANDAGPGVPLLRKARGRAQRRSAVG